MNLTDEELDLLIMALEKLQFSGDVKNRGQVLHLLGVAESALKKLRQQKESGEE